MENPDWHKNLPLGLYELHWTEEEGGGISLASVGYDQKGDRWYAPVNWLTVPCFDWGKVEMVRLIRRDPKIEWSSSDEQ